MIVGLYGIRGTYNFGCEAIVRGSVLFIKDVFPKAKIVYYSYSYEYDKKALSDVDVAIQAIDERRSILLRGINKILGFLGVKKRIILFNQKKLFKGVDVILSIGGDIYTIPAFLLKKRKYPYYNSLVDFCERSKKDIVAYGVSAGPWGNYKKAIDYYLKNLMSYKAILFREYKTGDYLNGLGFNNAMFLPDPAFLLGKSINDNGDSIGINLSPLSFREVKGRVCEEDIIIVANVIDKLYEKTHKKIVFLPHVLSNDLGDNDLCFINQIKDKMHFGGEAVVIEGRNGFFDIKKQIRKCCIVIAARMHCAINAIEEDVPAIFLTYSQKSVGMCEYIYGDRKWIVELGEMQTKLIPVALDMCQNRTEISNYLHDRNIMIKKDYFNNIINVRKMLSDLCEDSD